MQIYGLGWDREDGRIGLSDLYCTDGDEIRHFTGSEGLMGYMVSDVFLADLNGDGLYEVHANATTGSGISHDFVQSYDTATGTFSALSERFMKEFHFAIFEERLYLVMYPGPIGSYAPTVSRPVLRDGALAEEQVDQALRDRVLAAHPELAPASP
jgi:hypothetical protein